MNTDSQNTTPLVEGAPVEGTLPDGTTPGVSAPATSAPATSQFTTPNIAYPPTGPVAQYVAPAYQSGAAVGGGSATTGDPASYPAGAYAAGSGAPGTGAPALDPKADGGRNSYGFAVASFVLGIASIVSGWTIVAPVAGLVLGILALKRKTPERTLALWGVWLNGIILGFAVLGILLIIGALTLGLATGVFFAA